MRVVLSIGLAAAALFSGAAGPALAQEGLTVFGRNLNATVRARAAPDYIGSDDYKLVPGGSISLTLPGKDSGFGAPDDGASLTLFGDDVLGVGLSGRLQSGRDNDDDLRGFDEIDRAVEAGAFVNWWAADWLRTRVDARRGFGGHEGWVVDLGADLVSQEGPWTMSIGPRLRWTDDEYARTYFGVTPPEAARSPFPIAAYEAEGGLSSAGVVASAWYQWRPAWRVVADAEYRKLVGDAADSPIVGRLGSEDQFTASIGLRYSLR